MTKIAIAYSTRNKLKTVERTLEALVERGNHKFDLFWTDGSDDLCSLKYFEQHSACAEVANTNVRGGPDAGIVFNLTTMLAHPAGYTHVGLVEDDVLLYDGWLEETMALFEHGEKDGLKVGAVSARAYVDRILVQRDGYALMHNLGAGMVIFTREAAEIVLDSYGTGMTLGNRRVFAQLCGLDIGGWWAFKGGEHWLGSDWQFDARLASRGLASLALTPSKVQMIDQDPPLYIQGLAIADKPVGKFENEKAFDRFSDSLAAIELGEIELPAPLPIFDPSTGTWLWFAHQIHKLGGRYEDDWRLRFVQGFGPFAWKAGNKGASATIPVSGLCEVLVSGGEMGGEVRIEDPATKFVHEPMLPTEVQTGGQVVSLPLPCSVGFREIKLTALSPGICFFGVRTREPQIAVPSKFDYSVLPTV